MELESYSTQFANAASSAAASDQSTVAAAVLGSTFSAPPRFSVILWIRTAVASDQSCVRINQVATKCGRWPVHSILPSQTAAKTITKVKGARRDHAEVKNAPAEDHEKALEERVL